MQLKAIPEDFIVREVATHSIKPSGSYLLIELTKKNMTTEHAVQELARQLNLPRKYLAYAGTKDSRAITTQYVSIKTAENVERFHHPQIQVRTLGFINESLGLGSLAGNRFEIVCRKLKEERLRERTQFPNYFDEQRFSAANSEIGRHILKGEFKEATETLIKHDQEARGRIEQHLALHKNEYVGALRLIPKNQLLFYVHAFQSELYNKILTRYIRENDPAARIIDGKTLPSKELENIDIPIIGFSSELESPFEEWCGELLAQEQLTLRDFVVRAIPFLTVEGTTRKAFFEVTDVEIGDREQDDLNPGFEKQKLAFTLPKSCYATLVVKFYFL